MKFVRYYRISLRVHFAVFFAVLFSVLPVREPSEEVERDVGSISTPPIEQESTKLGGAMGMEESLEPRSDIPRQLKAHRVIGATSDKTLSAAGYSPQRLHVPDESKLVEPEDIRTSDNHSNREEKVEEDGADSKGSEAVTASLKMKEPGTLDGESLYNWVPRWHHVDSIPSHMFALDRQTRLCLLPLSFCIGSSCIVL